MIKLINENKFDELKESLDKSTEFQIHNFLLDVLNNKTIEIDNESFSAKKYQEEFLEGLKIFEALLDSKIGRIELNNFLNILVELAFKMGGVIQLMSKTAMDKGLDLSEIKDIYTVDPSLRQKLQNFIGNLRNLGNQDKSIANLAATKAQISNSIGNLVEKFEIGEDMIQFAQSYENVGQTEMSTKIYRGIMNDFEAESVKSSSGLFPEIGYIDDRPEKEIAVFETAKKSFERLTGQIIIEPKRVHITDNDKLDKWEQEMEKIEREENSFFNKLKRLFKKN